MSIPPTATTESSPIKHFLYGGGGNNGARGLGSRDSTLDFFEQDDKYVFKARNLKLRNLENLRLKPFFCTQYPFVFVWAGRR